MQARNVSRAWGRVVSVSIGLAVTGLSVACSDDDPVAAVPPVPDAGAMDVFVPAPPSPTPPPPLDGEVPPLADAPAPTDATGPSEDTRTPDAPPSAGEVPSTAAALFPWLQGRNYSSWARESEVHPSAGPHGRVRVYVSPSLEGSLAAGDATHPVGAAAVKVLYDRDDDPDDDPDDDDDDDDVEGWAVMVKVAPGSGADTWYFYEIFSTTDPSSPVEGRGAPGCAGCHSIGRDHFRSAYPLR